MYQKRSREVFKSLKALAVFMLSLVLLLPAMPVTVQAADEYNIVLDVPYINQGNYTTPFYDSNGNKVYNDEGKEATVARSGCGAASSAMVIGYYKNTNINPNDMFQRAVDRGLYQGNGLSHYAVSNICASDSVNVTWTSSVSDAISAIKNSRPVIANMGPGTFTSYGHYIVLVGYRKDSNGNEFFLVNDPNHPNFCGCEFTRSTITSELGGDGFGITSFTAVTSLTISPAMDSTTLQAGKSCNITGYVASNVKLTEVTGQILNSSGTAVQTVTVNPDASYLDLKSSKVNMNLKFGTLSDGSYTLKISAKDANNKTGNKTISFTVGNGSSNPGVVTPDPASILSIKGLALDTYNITKGNSCNINGTVTSNYVIKSVKGEIIDSTGKVVQTITTNPNSKSLNLRTSVVNLNLKFGTLAAGSYTLRITAVDSKKSTTSALSFTVKTPGSNPASTLKITNLAPSNVTITKGSSYNITGTVSSNYTISTVKGEFIDSTGKTVQSVSISPNAKSVDLKSTNINANLKFGSLAAGNYTLKVTATDAKTSVSSSKSFTIKNASVAGLTGSVSMATTSVSYGSGCNITGSFSSGSKITSVVGKIINSSGTVVQTQSISPNSTSVDLKSSAINANLKFGKLSRGGYTLQVTAKDAAGNTLTKNVTFSVK